MTQQTIEPVQVQRNAVLAQVLEPLATKTGCTTRSSDRNVDLKLQHFHTCAVNSGQFFFRLAERAQVLEYKQPRVFMDLAYECLCNAKVQIKSNKSINHGIIKTMFPLVVSHLVHNGSVSEICHGVVKVLQHSSVEDAEYQNEIYRLGFQTSDKTIKKQYAELDCDTTNLYGNYQERAAIAPAYDFDPCWAQEFLQGLPTVLWMYEIAAQHIKNDFVSATEPAYNWAIENTNHGCGMVADLCVAVDYLLLISHTDESLI